MTLGKLFEVWENRLSGRDVRARRKNVFLNHTLHRDKIEIVVVEMKSVSDFVLGDGFFSGFLASASPLTRVT